MDNVAMKKVAIKAAIFGAVSIAVMLQRSATKHIMITDAAGVTIDRGDTQDYYKILVDRNVDESQKGKLIIPLAKSVSSDDIVLEDDYVDHELRIYIDSREEGFYLDNAVITDLNIFDSAVCYKENDSGSVCLDFKLNDFYVNESSLTETGTMIVEFAKPSQKYDKIVVVNPVGGGETGDNASSELAKEDVALDVALALKAISEKDSDNDVKFFFTRTTDREVDDRKRVDVIKASEADLVLEIGASSSDNTDDSGLTAYYNDVFFTRNITNAEFADKLERSCAKKTGGKANGVIKTDENDLFLMESTVTGAGIDVGYITSEKDKNKLAGAGYKKKAAEGIYEAVLDTFKEME